MIKTISQFVVKNKYLVILGSFALLNILVVNLFLISHTTPFASDSQGYLEMAKYFRGLAPDTLAHPERTLKPVVPFLTALASYVFGLKPAFLFVNSVIFFLVGFVIFKIIDILFDDQKQALVGSLLFLFAYPMLKYGITYMTDLAGWFFFALSVYLTLLFLKKPSYKLMAWNGLVCSVGILTKEYIIPGGFFLFICLFFIHKDNFAKKLKYFSLYLLVLLAPFVMWQAFVFFRFHYSYYDWYKWGYQKGFSFDPATLKLIVKSLLATFFLGWLFVLAGVLRFRKLKDTQQKLILALIIPSFSFLLWPAETSRLFYVIGVMLAILASWGLAGLSNFWQKKYVFILGTAAVIFVNYFWFLYDDRFRALINSALKIIR